MRYIVRLDSYRKRRHRAAVKQKGIRRRKHRVNSHLRGPETIGLDGADPPELRAVLSDLIRRMCGYPGVRGVLCRRNLSSIYLNVVALPPMVRPMRVLGENWLVDLRAAYPGYQWEVGVCTQPPEDEHLYLYACWRDS